MKKTLLLALLLANASATAKVTGAKWALYDRHIPAYSITTQTTVAVLFQTTETSTVKIYGQRNDGPWHELSDWLPADVEGSTGSLVVNDLVDGLWSFYAQAGDGIQGDPFRQYSFWVVLPVAIVARWTLFR
jgi:hypothetical protein